MDHCHIPVIMCSEVCKGGLDLVMDGKFAFPYIEFELTSFVGFYVMTSTVSHLTDIYGYAVHG